MSCPPTYVKLRRAEVVAPAQEAIPFFRTSRRYVARCGRVKNLHIALISKKKQLREFPFILEQAKVVFIPKMLTEEVTLAQGSLVNETKLVQKTL